MAVDKKKILDVKKAFGSFLITCLVNATLPVVVWVFESFDIITAAYLCIIWNAFVYFGVVVIMNVFGTLTAAERAKYKQAIKDAQNQAKVETPEMIRDSTDTHREVILAAKNIQAEVQQVKELNQEPTPQ